MRFAAFWLVAVAVGGTGCGTSECGKGFRLADGGGCELDLPRPCTGGQIRTIAGECADPYVRGGGGSGPDTDIDTVDTDDTIDTDETDDTITTETDTDWPIDSTPFVDTSDWGSGDESGGNTGDSGRAN